MFALAKKHEVAISKQRSQQILSFLKSLDVKSNVSSNLDEKKGEDVNADKNPDRGKTLLTRQKLEEGKIAPQIEVAPDDKKHDAGDALTQSTQDCEDGFILVTSNKEKKKKSLEEEVGGSFDDASTLRSFNQKLDVDQSVIKIPRKVSDQTSLQSKEIKPKIHKKLRLPDPIKSESLCKLIRSYVDAKAIATNFFDNKIAIFDLIDSIKSFLKKPNINVNELEFKNGPTPLDILDLAEIDQDYFNLRYCIKAVGGIDTGYYDLGYPFLCLIPRD